MSLQTLISRSEKSLEREERVGGEGDTGGGNRQVETGANPTKPRSHQSSTEVEQGELVQLEPQSMPPNRLLSFISIFHQHFLHEGKSNLTGNTDFIYLFIYSWTAIFTFIVLQP